MIYIFMTLALAGVEQERHCGGKSYANIEMPPDGKVKANQIEIFLSHLTNH